MSFKRIIQLITSVLICQMAGIVGTVFTVSALPSWYEYLNKPSFNPPPWVFAPVWTILYSMMGISLFFIWKTSKERNKHKGLLVFFIQLFFNAIWSPLFFGLRSPFIGFIVIILLLASIVWTIFHFFKISKTAAWLLLPYLLWVSFATFLNFAIWQLNP